MGRRVHEEDDNDGARREDIYCRGGSPLTHIGGGRDHVL